LEAAEFDLRLPEGGGFGTLHEADDRTRTQVIETVRAAFDPYVHGAEVRFTAACWMVGASKPQGAGEGAGC
jgi:hypothetical protein